MRPIPRAAAQLEPAERRFLARAQDVVYQTVPALHLPQND